VTSSDFGAATTLRNNATLSNVAKAVTYNDATRTLTVNPSADLTPGTSYTLTLSGAGASGIQDLTGNALSTTAITFTSTPDLLAPTITTVAPFNGATGVRLTTNVVVNFSERVQGISATSVVLTNNRTGANVAKALVVNAAGTRVTLTPNVNLARNTTYRLTLIGGGARIRDMAGNAFVNVTTVFRTRP
jgi:methionine-rich copper-binding protein CopC